MLDKEVVLAALAISEKKSEDLFAIEPQDFWMSVEDGQVVISREKDIGVPIRCEVVKIPNEEIDAALKRRLTLVDRLRIYMYEFE